MDSEDKKPPGKMGWLKGGNPAAHWTVMLTSPRCGARAKGSGQPCKLGALKGKKRCRLHGGLSTGAKTPEGKARQRAANLKHGFETREMRAHRSEMAKQRREWKGSLRALRRLG